MMSHRKERRGWFCVLVALTYAVTLLALIVVLTGCKSERTRPPGRDDVVQPTARATVHPCRCDVRPPMKRGSRR